MYPRYKHVKTGGIYTINHIQNIRSSYGDSSIELQDEDTVEIVRSGPNTSCFRFSDSSSYPRIMLQISRRELLSHSFDQSWVLYSSEHGQFARLEQEFFDGRFEKVDPNEPVEERVQPKATILKYTGTTRNDLSPAEVLQAAIEEEVYDPIIVALDKNGKLYVSAARSELAENILLLARAQRYLLDQIEDNN